MFVLMPVDNGCLVQKLNIKKVTQKNPSHSVRELYYANLGPEIKYTNFLVDSDFKNGVLEGSFSGELIATGSLSSVIRINQGRVQVQDGLV